MSGASIPYRLRKNKAVDRVAFIEIVEICSRYFDISKYRYIGFGGNSLEDFKLIHNRLGIRKLTSIEVDHNIIKRQIFNKPVKCIELINKSSGDFLRTAEFNDSIILWLDYTVPNEIGVQLQEIDKAIREMSHGDVIKVTLNANASALHQKQNMESEADVQKARRKKLEGHIGSLPVTTTLPDFTSKRYPKYLTNLVLGRMKSFAKKSSPSKQFVPLGVFTYADGQPMISITGILLNYGSKSKFIHQSRFKNWPLYFKDESSIYEISIPDMTPKEKIHIDSMLPDEPPSRITKRMKFYFGNSKPESEKLLKAYRIFYKHSIYFSEINL